jgi:hypothetical protein
MLGSTKREMRKELKAFCDNDGVDSSRATVRVRGLGTGVRHDV